jgi:hypothetical protein
MPKSSDLLKIIINFLTCIVFWVKKVTKIHTFSSLLQSLSLLLQPEIFHVSIGIKFFHV